MGAMLKGMRSLYSRTVTPLSAKHLDNPNSAGLRRPMSMEAMLTELSGADEASSMQQYVRQNGRERSWAGNPLWSGMWRATIHEATHHAWDNPYGNNTLIPGTPSSQSAEHDSLHPDSRDVEAVGFVQDTEQRY
jgi:hypothetical protein